MICHLIDSFLQYQIYQYDSIQVTLTLSFLQRWGLQRSRVGLGSPGCQLRAGGDRSEVQKSTGAADSGIIMAK